MDLHHTQPLDIADHREHGELIDLARGTTRTAPRQATAPAVYGSGWYHDAAIEQASRTALDARCNPYG